MTKHRPRAPLSFRTRPIGKADSALLWEAIYHAIFVPSGGPPLPREIVRDPLIARYVEDWGRRDDVGLLAELPDGATIGAAWVRLLCSDRRGYGHVDDETPELSIAVWPGYRGQGVGTSLLEDLFRVTDRRWKALSLSVAKDNPAAKLYARLGFRAAVDDGKSLIMVRPHGLSSTSVPERS